MKGGWQYILWVVIPMLFLACTRTASTVITPPIDTSAPEIRALPPIDMPAPIVGALPLDERLQRYEGVSCEQLVLHADEPPPNCQAIVDALERARSKVAALHPEALRIMYSSFTLYRGKRFYRPPRTVPLIQDGSGLHYIQGFYQPQGGYIAYSHEGAVECEAIHGFMFISGDAFWAEAGHGGENDPLKWDCGAAVEKAYKL